MKYVPLAALSLAIVPTAALAADRSAAAACAARLGPDAKQIYSAVAPDIGPTSIIRDALVARVKPMVMAGTMSRGAAKAAGTSAAACLKLLR